MALFNFHHIFGYISWSQPNQFCLTLTNSVYFNFGQALPLTGFVKGQLYLDKCIHVSSFTHTEWFQKISCNTFHSYRCKFLLVDALHIHVIKQRSNMHATSKVNFMKPYKSTFFLQDQSVLSKIKKS